MRFKNSNEIKILICLLTIFICFVKPLKFFSQNRGCSYDSLCCLSNKQNGLKSAPVSREISLTEKWKSTSLLKNSNVKLPLFKLKAVTGKERKIDADSNNAIKTYLCWSTLAAFVVAGVKWNFLLAKFLTSRHVLMGRVIFYISNTLRKLYYYSLGIRV